MANVTRYVPRSVRLAPRSGVRRNLRRARPRFGDHPFSAGELDEYDDSTLLYDVFLDHRNERLLAVGPPLLNLRPACEPLNVYVRDDRGDVVGPLVYRDRECDETVSIFAFDLPAGVATERGLSLTLRIDNVGEKELSIPASSSTPVRLAMGAIQRDNAPHWISDWARYHHDIGVERLVLYDNRSENADQVRAVLDGLPDDLEVVLVDWDFKYGPARGWGNRFAQRGMLNHLALKWGDAQWVLNVDIDEYVVVPRADACLRELLEAVDPGCAIVRFRRYNCPVLDDYRIDDLTQASVRDFPVRMRDPLDRFPKYLYRPAQVRCLTPHWGTPVGGCESRDMEPRDLCAFHYLGITTGWKDDMHRAAGSGARSTRRVPFSSTRHVRDDSVIARMTRIDAR